MFWLRRESRRRFTASVSGFRLSCAALTVAIAAGSALCGEPGKSMRGLRGTSGSAQRVAADRRFTPLEVTLDATPTLRVTTTGWSMESANTSAAGQVAGSTCGATTHANPATFGGGSLYIQQGFAQGEVAWAVFDIDPSLFPVKIERMEFVFAQDAVEQTRTDWSLLIMDGPPAGGLPKWEFDSTGAVLPQVVLDPGLVGVNVQIDVGPDDPEQLILTNESGLDSISVGYRIDVHNNPPADNCLPADSSTNAFPATDADGVSSLTGNWLSAITCPLSPCNGTNSFADLGICRPSGDWLIRVTFSCTSIGACCNLEEGCVDDVTDVDCASRRGTFMGAESVCSALTCPPPNGACCTRDACLEGVDQPLCEALTDGVFMGNVASCDAVNCDRGACCMPDAACFDVIESECDRLGGTFEGGGTDCATFDCPQPTGSCCIETFCFANQTRDVCESLGTFNGFGSTCDPDPCGPSCPVATIIAASPFSGSLDARQPHEPDAPLVRQGIGSAAEPITLTLGEPGADACFTLCETAADPLLGANGISGVTDLGGGVYEIILDHAIASGAVTTIRYEGDGSYVSYLAHPGNVDGDAFADATDIGVLIDGVTGATAVPELLAGDVDRSGAVAPADILRLIDLLNGADDYAGWLDTPLPVNGSCP